MEPTAQKSLERVICQRAMQMSSSLPCRIWALGFISAICITYLFLLALTPSRSMEFGLVYSSPSTVIPRNSSSIYFSKGDFSPFLYNAFMRSLQPFAYVNSVAAIYDSDIIGHVNYDSVPKGIIKLENSKSSGGLNDEDRALLLYAAWSAILNESKGGENKCTGEMKKSSIPQAPHLEKCKSKVETNKRLDSRGTNGSLPPWTLWRGFLGLILLQPSQSVMGQGQKHKLKLKGAYPPWIVGSDEDNYPLTRQVQKDIWIHQHPQDCGDPNLRFLVAEWERLPGFGIGAQLAGMSGMLAIAINENRILVTDYYNRADHNGCQGSSRSRWSCYFFPETTLGCQVRAFDLMKNQEAWKNGIITVKDNYTSKEIWAGRVPRVWGEPWSYLQPTTEVDGSLLMHHRKMDRRWWRAQAVRYLMRFQSEYTCGLLNVARHTAFGLQAAKMVLGSFPTAWPEVAVNRSQADIEHFVWYNHKPWIPRPLLSMHVRMGDKAYEMKVVDFQNYMQLAERIREHFPILNSIWLSTEMQEVIDKSKLYPHWNFYYTNVTRQAGNITMATYEASLGRKTSTNYPLVNFIMATEADFFVGALGSTWCFLIDGMRNTGGKVMAGYLSVNKDRFW